MTRLAPFALAATLSAACSPQVVDAVGDCDVGVCAGTSGGGASGRGGANSVGGGTASTPIHRYSFDATGTSEVVDSIGDRHGTLVGAEYGTGANAGTVLLAGRPADQYIDLPNHLLAGLRNATFESWVTWQGGDAWQRVFDFGEDDTGVDDSRAGHPRSYLFLALKPQARVAFEKPPTLSPETITESSFAIPTAALTHLAVVVDEQNQLITLFVNGRAENNTKFTATLLDVYDVNVWLGRSQYSSDPAFNGSFSEFRIYDHALTSSQILASYAAGPDAAF